ncbi:MAG: beta-ketoacyl-[acyl-carrier-protein] synthase family protein [Elusimicrobiota bacterium]
MSLKRVVITGVGAVSPLGNTVGELVGGVEEGKCAVKSMDEWRKYNGLRSLVGAPAELKNMEAIPRQRRRSMSRISIFSVQAAEQALVDAGLDKSRLSSGRIGCIIGSTMGGTQSISEAFEMIIPDRDISRLTSTKLFQCFSHTAAMNVSQYLEINGFVMATCAACASGLQAIGTGYDLIRLGRQDAVLCGGAEELHPIVAASFDVLYAASTKFNDRPQKSSRPFDRDRDGVVCGEGCGVVVLEDYEQARKRKARIYGEIIGYNTNGSGVHVSQSNAEAMAACIRDALKEAQIEPGAVDYINAHATATVQGDQSEVKAIKEIFGSDVPISSLKGHIGHTLGASGVLELIVTLAMMDKQVIYPTLNLENIADDCQGINHVVKSFNKTINTFVTNCFAFGGINSVMVCKKLN